MHLLFQNVVGGDRPFATHPHQRFMFRRFILFLFIVIISGFITWRSINRHIVNFSERDETRQADAAVVLGAGVIRNRPSSVLRARIDHAVKLYEDGYVDTLIFTGGVGRNDQLSEAEVSRQYAVARGIPNSAILIEERSTNTIENLTFAQQVGSANDVDTYLIVSTPYHMARAIWISRDLDMEAYTSPTRTIRWRSEETKQAALIQETISYMLHIFRRYRI